MKSDTLPMSRGKFNRIERNFVHYQRVKVKKTVLTLVTGVDCFVEVYKKKSRCLSSTNNLVEFMNRIRIAFSQLINNEIRRCANNLLMKIYRWLQLNKQQYLAFQIYYNYETFLSWLISLRFLTKKCVNLFPFHLLFHFYYYPDWTI